MKITKKVREILSYYESDNAGTKRNLAQILSSGKLGGTGKMVILPVDQGFEHGPARSFAPNPDGYDPEYHIKLAIDAGLNAYAAPLGMIEAVANSYAGAIPLILKVNSSNSLAREKEAPHQALTGSVSDAIRLGCSAIGFTVYPGSDAFFDMAEEIKELSEEAKSYGLAVVVWSYARGGNLTKQGETAIDTIAYAAHMAALLGAHIIKVKPPTNILDQEEAKKVYIDNNIPIETLSERIAHVKQACFNGKRIVIFSGGTSKSVNSLYDEIKQIRDGGGNGSIIGRNTFQRPRDEALAMLDEIIKIYKS
ncbi:MAG: class I fructose-bisphosphate aldolase [Rickettsiales bacterium]|jgi:fructose-bisphosphate aldolase, class I|nr:class I fructose-bisphosphate aldolase [Rickettsiales bacterium]